MRLDENLNGVKLSCVFDEENGYELGSVQAGSMYGIGIGDGVDGYGIFIDREQAAELLESLLEFIQGGE